MYSESQHGFSVGRGYDADAGSGAIPQGRRWPGNGCRLRDPHHTPDGACAPPRGAPRAGEESLPGYLRQARELLAARPDHIDDGPTGLPGDFEALRWFPLPPACPYAGIPILAVSAVIWQLGRLARAPGQGHARPRHLLLITVVVTGVSLAALVISFLGSRPGGLR